MSPKINKTLFFGFLLFFSLFPFFRAQFKQIWVDELLSVIYATGHTTREVYEHFYGSNKVFSSEDLKAYLSPTGSPLAILKNVLTNYPLQSAPYYLILYYWIKWFGNNPTNMAMLSALIHLLALPSLAWLLFELYGWTTTTIFGLILVATSPIHFHFAQEIRPYEIWIVLIYLVNAMLLMALRRKTPKAWTAYFLLLSFCLHFSLFAIPLWAAHLGTIIFLNFQSKTVHFKGFLYSSFGAFLTFIPYLVSSIWLGHERFASELSWLTIFPAHEFFRFSGENWQRLFFDFMELEPTTMHFTIYSVTFLFLIYCIRCVLRDSQNLFGILLFWMLTTSFLPLFLYDIAQSAVTSVITRYILPPYLLVQISVARTLVLKIENAHGVSRIVSKLGILVLPIIQIFWVFQSNPEITFSFPHLNHTRKVLLNSKNTSIFMTVTDYDPNRTQGGAFSLHTLALAYNMPPNFSMRRIRDLRELNPQTSTPFYIFSPDLEIFSNQMFAVLPVEPRFSFLYQVTKKSQH